MRQRSSTLLLLGDGKGIVDASIAGVLDGSSILYAGQLTNKQLATRATEFASVVVTDTHTERAQHWRTSIDTNGMDEDRDGGLVNFGRDPGDIRMRIFPRNRPDDKTWFEQVGPVRARASSYGPPLSYRPEHRPFAAIDNNPSTAWTVAHGVQPLAPVLSLVTDTPINSIRLLQPTDNPNRVISDISLSLDGGTWEGVSMTEESLTTGQEIALSSPASSIALRIDTVRTIREPAINEELAGVGFAEVATGLSPTTEIGVLPTRGLDTVSSTTPLSYVMSRRVAPLFRDSRTDIETLWSREFSVPNERSFTVSARIDTSLFNREQVVDLLNEISSQPLVSLDGQALSLIPTYNEAQQAIVAETNPLVLTAGSHQIDTTWASESLPAAIDQVTLRSMPTTASQAQVMFPDFTDGLVKKSATLEPCPDGCWLVLGEGYSAGWSATMDEQSLGEPQAVDGGANGWWLAPFDEQKRVTLEFTPQKTLNIALILTALSVVLSLAILFVAMWRLQRKQISDDSLQETFTNVFSTRISFVVTTSVTAVVFLSLFTLTIAVATTLLLVLSRFIVPVKNLERAICALFVVTMTSSVWEIISTDPPLNFAWASATSGSHHTILYAVTALAVLSLVPESRQKIRSRSQRSGQ